MAARGLAIRVDVATAAELRGLAKKEARRRTAQRMLAIASALDGMSRAEAAQGPPDDVVAIRPSAIHPVQRPRRDRHLRCIAERGRMGW